MLLALWKIIVWKWIKAMRTKTTEQGKTGQLSENTRYRGDQGQKQSFLFLTGQK